jgi:hypothetical protein
VHPWFFNFKYNGVDHRFNLNKEAGKPNDRPLPKTDVEALRDGSAPRSARGRFATARAVRGVPIISSPWRRVR